MHTARTVLVTGASGFIGRHLCAALRARGDRVIALRRDRALMAADPVDAVINLAGARILGPPWTDGRRRLLRASRIGTTQRLVAALGERSQRPAVLVSASAVGYYGVRGEQPVDESDGPQDIFQSRLCADWEQAATAAEALGVRVVRLRLGVVLGRDGGALPQLAFPARLGLGAVMGDGQQGMPWIHIDDVVQLFLRALDDATLSGAVNAVAPETATQRQFQQALAQALHRPLWLRVPAAPLRWALGEMAQLLVDGQHVLPTAALAAGFRFRFPTLAGALADLYGEAR